MNSSIERDQPHPPKSPVLGGNNNNFGKSYTTTNAQQPTLHKFESIKEDYPDDQSAMSRKSYVGPFGDRMSHAGSRSSQVGLRTAKYTKKKDNSPVNVRKTTNEALAVPEDAGMILKMLFRPQKFGNGTLFDYTC